MFYFKDLAKVLIFMNISPFDGSVIFLSILNIYSLNLLLDLLLQLTWNKFMFQSLILSMISLSRRLPNILEFYSWIIWVEGFCFSGFSPPRYTFFWHFVSCSLPQLFLTDCRLSFESQESQWLFRAHYLGC